MNGSARLGISGHKPVWFTRGGHAHRRRACCAVRPRCSAKEDSGMAGLAALETTLQVINGFIARGSAADARASQNGNTRVVKKDHWVSFRGKGSSRTNIEAQGSLVRTLEQYLALPVSEYSLLDPKAITRDPMDPNVFCLSFPVGILEDMFGLKLEPKVWIRVDSNPRDSSVTFSSERATLGDPRLDATFRLDMSSTLTAYGRERASTMGRLKALLPKAFWRQNRTDPEPIMSANEEDAPDFNTTMDFSSASEAAELNGVDSPALAKWTEDGPGNVLEEPALAMGHEAEGREGFVHREEPVLAMPGARDVGGESGVALWQGNEAGGSGGGGRAAILAAQDATLGQRGVAYIGSETLEVAVEPCEGSEVAERSLVAGPSGFAGGVEWDVAVGSVAVGQAPNPTASSPAGLATLELAMVELHDGEDAAAVGERGALGGRQGLGDGAGSVVGFAGDAEGLAHGDQGRAMGAAGDVVGGQGLSCSVDVNMRFNMPAPFNAVPAPLLGTAGGLIVKAILKAALPSFLQLLARDYMRWASLTADKDALRDKEGAVGHLSI